MKIETLNTHSPFKTAFDAFVKAHSLTFHSPNWIANYNSENIVECVILNNNNEIIGCFNYYRFSKLIFKLFITPPFAPNISLYYRNPSESVVGKHSFDKDVMDCLAAFFSGLNADLIDLNLPQETVDTQPFTWKKFNAKTRYSYLVDLSLSEEQLKNNLSTEKRKSLNRAQKDNLEVKESHDYKLVYDLVLQSLKRNGLDKNLDIISNILFKYATAQNAFAFVCYNNSQPIGASFCVIDRNKAIYLFGGFDSESKHHGAGVSCMWQSILKARELKLSYFDFEGSMNIKIERYFREFGGKFEPYYCVEKIKPVMNMLIKLRS